MLSRALLEREALQIGYAYRAPILALAAALAARLLRSPALFAAAAGLGGLAGWTALTGTAALLHPEGVAERLPVLAAFCAGAALLSQAVAARRMAPAFPLMLGLVCGWWLVGAPLREAVFLGQWKFLLAIVAAMLVCLRAGGEDEGWAPLSAALALWGSLMAARAPAFWTLAALVPAAALLPALLRRGADGLGSAGALVVGAAAAADLALGALRWGRFGLLDAACLAPVAALLLRTRLRQFPGPVGSLVAAGACVIAIVIGRLMRL